MRSRGNGACSLCSDLCARLEHYVECDAQLFTKRTSTVVAIKCNILFLTMAEERMFFRYILDRPGRNARFIISRCTFNRDRGFKITGRHTCKNKTATASNASPRVLGICFEQLRDFLFWLPQAARISSPYRKYTV